MKNNVYAKLCKLFPSKTFFLLEYTLPINPLQKFQIHFYSRFLTETKHETNNWFGSFFLHIIFVISIPEVIYFLWSTSDLSNMSSINRNHSWFSIENELQSFGALLLQFNFILPIIELLFSESNMDTNIYTALLNEWVILCIVSIFFIQKSTPNQKICLVW